MIKTTFTSLIFMFFITSVHAQHLWYENETDTKNILYQNSTSGTFTLGEVNPNITGINTNTIVSRFTRDVDASSAFTNFRLSQPIENVTEYSISLDAYIDRSTAKVLSNSSRFRVFLESSTLGGRIYKQLNFTEGEEWQNFNFTFGEGDFAQDILTSGGYDIMTIGYANGQSPEEEIVYYFDNIYGSSEQAINSLVPNPNLDWLTGSWGITFPVFGGERLDDEVSVGYNHLDGADEIIEKLPEVGHVITNLSYFAHSHYFTLSENSYVDVATEIHPSMVPNEDNDEIIFDVLQKFKDSGKKVILYISTNYFERADEEVKEAWVAYYTDKFGGDEYFAYENLCKGFIEKVKDFADGYWLDTTINLDSDGKLDDFIEMIREVDPDAVISANRSKKYLEVDGQTVYVDSDSFNDEDTTNYKIVIHEPLNNYQDFTNGHVTPLGTGAPANSWAYDEFTIPNMVAEPWTIYDNRLVLKHAWFPIREKWHSPRVDLLFDVEQAYRFVKSVVDAGASITFANTTDYGVWNAGYMMQDEMAIMKEVNDRLALDNVSNYEPYVRPEGAYLVGEEIAVGINEVSETDIKRSFISPNPVIHKLNINLDLESIDVYDINGNKHEMLIDGQNDIDVSALESGVYFAHIFTKDGEVYVRKFLKR